MNFLRRLTGVFAGETGGSHEELSLRARLRDVEERQDALERNIKHLKADWDEAYEKQQHLMARITKRSAALARERAELEAGNSEASSTGQDARTAVNGRGGATAPFGASVPGAHETLVAMRRRNGLLPR